eukprot:TRINITY_DN1919_c0_g1_i2.p1 TRINITY_DN1919_c0_g1~~TRINITY_DN1919_c0_g1_i2.p1  ORF type:complete len:628 (+),score=126.99 TRINITY_DN1919_c0_g1_i2:93-1976(+)
MSFRGIRASKFRHVYGSPAKKGQCFENIRLTKSAHDSNFCAVNPKFLALVVETSGGGSFVVLHVDQPNRSGRHVCRVVGHTAQVLDIKWNPFNDNIIASASEDCTVKLWYIPETATNEDIDHPLVELNAHRRKVSFVEWHPTADNILASVGFDNIIIIWDVSRGSQVKQITCHSDTIYSLAFDRNGSKMVTTCKDKIIRIIEPRSGDVIKQGPSHQGNKASKATYLGDSGMFLSTGFNRYSDREISIWTQADLDKPLKTVSLDSSSGVLNPVYDFDTKMVYIIGKGDGNVRYYEIIDSDPYICYLNEFVSGSPQRGMGIMPKRGVDVTTCEIFRLYKLHATKDVVEPVSMIVPRKSNVFQQDIYPETLAPIPALSASEWTTGKNASPVLLSMKTASRTKTFKPVVYKPAENAIVASEKNNDRKFMFLLEETKPDYRPLNERGTNEPSPQIDHRLFGEEAYQKRNADQSKLSAKDIKTSQNLETKFQSVQKRWVEGNVKKNVSDSFEIYKTNLISGSNSVKSLTTRFDTSKEGDEGECAENLKEMYTAQQKQLYNLKTQVELRDQRINALEEQVKILYSSRHATPLNTPGSSAPLPLSIPNPTNSESGFKLDPAPPRPSATKSSPASS